jgi:hypothetical protein
MKGHTTPFHARIFNVSDGYPPDPRKDLRLASLESVTDLIRSLGPAAYVSDKFIGTIGDVPFLRIAMLPAEPSETLLQRAVTDLESKKGSAGLVLPLLTYEEIQDRLSEAGLSDRLGTQDN